MYLTLEQLVLKSANGEQYEDEFQKVTGLNDDDFDFQLLEVQLKLSHLSSALLQARNKIS